MTDTGKTITIMQISTGILSDWTIQEILNEINQTGSYCFRLDDWKDYTVKNWKEGWQKWCEGNIWKIVKRDEK